MKSKNPLLSYIDDPFDDWWRIFLRKIEKIKKKGIKKENKKEIIKEYKGEKAAKEVDTHKDIQLEAGIKAIKAMIDKK